MTATLPRPFKQLHKQISAAVEAGLTIDEIKASMPTIEFKPEDVSRLQGIKGGMRLGMAVKVREDFLNNE